jgi:hypothetical protein
MDFALKNLIRFLIKFNLKNTTMLSIGNVLKVINMLKLNDIKTQGKETT